MSHFHRLIPSLSKHSKINSHLPVIQNLKFKSKQSKYHSRPLTSHFTTTAIAVLAVSAFIPNNNNNNNTHTTTDDNEAEVEQFLESHTQNQRPQAPKYHNNPPFRQDLPTYTRAEIAKHYSPDCDTGDIWVSFRNGVYDMTSFLKAHPGRSGRIEMVGGQDLEPYWRVYRQHYRGHIIDFMEQNFRIGNVNSDELNDINYDMFWNGYLYNDPPRHPLSQGCTFAPYCSEAPMHLWTKSYFTPNEIFYVRNHAFVPDISEEDYELIVEINGKEHIFTYDDLLNIFPRYEVATTVQCAANRSEDYHGRSNGSTRGMFNPPHWNGGAFSTAKWGGARIRDILKYCGLPVDEMALNEEYYPQYQHLHMKAYDEDETGQAYGASTFLDKIVDPHGDCLIAYEMNGRKLPLDHGFPARVIIPGHAGARQPKWIHRLIVKSDEQGVSACLQFANDVTFEEDLKQWPPKKVVTKATNKGNIVQEMPVQSFICEPRQNGIIAVSKDAKEIYVKGVAWSGGGVGIHRVDISGDGGDNFSASKLIPKPMEQYRRGHWAWQQFEGAVPLSEVTRERLRLGEKVDLVLTSKAVNQHFNTQPATPDAQINPRGVAVNHWYKVHVTLIPNESLGETSHDGGSKTTSVNENGETVYDCQWVDISDDFIDHITNMSLLGTKGWKGNKSRGSGKGKKSEDYANSSAGTMNDDEMFSQKNRPSGGVWIDPWYEHGWKHPNGAKNGVNETAKDWIKILDKTTEKTDQARGISAEIDWDYYKNLGCMNYYDTPDKSQKWQKFEKGNPKRLW